MPQNDPSTEPLVSVVMPAFDAQAHVGEAIASIHAQCWPRIELVVVDDGSRDGTAARVRAEAARWTGTGRRLILRRQSNAGAGAARDAGIAAARGAWILLADADDTADPGLVRALMGRLAETGADLAFARCRYVDADGGFAFEQPPVPPRPCALDLLAGRSGFMVNTPLVRREAALAVGGHDHALRGAIDLDFLLKVALRRDGALAAVPGVLSSYRRAAGAGPGQITANWRNMRAGWLSARDAARRAGLRAGPREWRRMHGRQCAAWAALAYGGGEHAAARRLIGEAALRHPGFVLADPTARMRLMACAATLLPRGTHDRLQRWHNARAAARATAP